MAATNHNYAGFGVRFLAYLIDAVVIGIANFVITTVLSSMNMETLATILSVIVSWGYVVYMIGFRGQTLGKIALNLKVVKLNTNAHPDYVGAFVREIVGKLISGLVLGLGYLWVIWDPQKQGWHDKIAGTVVVKTK